MPSTVSGWAVTVDPWVSWWLYVWYGPSVNLLGSNKDIHTDKELTKTDFGLESSNACRNNLPIKLTNQTVHTRENG